MLVTLKEILAKAADEETAIGAFNCSGLECVRAIVQAAEEEERPVIIQYALLHEAYMPFHVMAPIMLQAARDAKVPVCVHFDHGASVEDCKRAIDAGFSSVMFDGSALPYEENVRRTQEVVSYAHKKGVSVEAELGQLGTAEIGAGESEGTVSAEDFYTDPDSAREFVDSTDVDALAITFGTAHGVYLVEPVLDLDRIRLVREKVSIPLVMHGGSGLEKEDYQIAIRNGIRKINFYTYMSMEGGNAVADFVKNEDSDFYFFHDMAKIAVEAMRELVKKQIRVFALEKEEEI